MNKSLLIQNGIAGGIAGTVADGLFKDEDNHNYAKSAFMGTLAGVGATALHQKWPVAKSGAQAPADHVPPTAPTQPTAAPTAPVQQPAQAEQPKVAEPIASKQESPVVAQAQPATPIKPEEPAKPIQTPVAPAESAKQPTAASEPVQQPAAAPSVEKQTERERAIEREPEARAQVEPKPAEQPVQTEPVKPIQITPEKQPKPAAAPIVEQPKPKPKPEPEPQPVEKAEAAPAPKPIEQPKAVQPVQAEPVQQPAAAPKPEPAPIKITPIEQPKPAAPVREEPAPKTAPVQTTAAPAPQPAPVAKAEPQAAPMKITPEEPKQAEPPKAVVPVKPSEEPKQEFVGPKDKPLSRKLTKTINSVKQSASNVGNGILEGAKNIVATASKLKIPPIELNIAAKGQQVVQAGRSIASGLARSAQALSIAAIASMDMGGGHAVVQHAYETAAHAVQVQASMATSTMTKAVKDAGEAVSNYHPGQGIENAIKGTQAMPKAAESTVAIPKAIQNYKNDDFALPMFQRRMENAPLLQNKLQASIVDSLKQMIDKPFKPSLQYRCADSVSTILDNAIQNSHTKPLKYSHQLEAKQFGKMNFQEIAYKDMKPGDIVAFTNTWRTSAHDKDFTHVGIYMGNDTFGHRPSRSVQLLDKSWSGGEFKSDKLSDWLSKRAERKVKAKAYRVNNVVGVQ